MRVSTRGGTEGSAGSFGRTVPGRNLQRGGRFYRGDRTPPPEVLWLPCIFLRRSCLHNTGSRFKRKRIFTIAVELICALNRINELQILRGQVAVRQRVDVVQLRPDCAPDGHFYRSVCEDDSIVAPAFSAFSLEAAKVLAERDRRKARRHQPNTRKAAE